MRKRSHKDSMDSMIVTFRSVDGLLFCFGLSRHRWNKRIVHSYIQEMARKNTWQFLSKFRFSSLSLKSGLRTFLPEWRHSSALANPFRNISSLDTLHNVAYFFRFSVHHYRGHKDWPSWQTKPSALERVERLEQLERIKITDASFETVRNGKMSVRSHVV